MSQLIFNLIDQSKSDIKYKISNFPDGQQDIVIESTIDCEDVVLIVARFKSFLNLELILCATAALRRIRIKEIHLYIPYMLGGRSDRQFQEGGTSYLVDVVAPILNAQKYKTICVLDAHSSVMAACIPNLTEIPASLVVTEVFKQLNFGSDFVIVSPDAGSLKKVYDVAQAWTSEGNKAPEIAIANKHRDVITGKILSTGISDISDFIRRQLPFVIVDDICDGGRTFVEIAKVIEAEYRKTPPINVFPNLPFPKVYLVVSHGIFSAGFETLNQYFDGIFCTDSYCELEDDNLIIIPSIS